MKKREREKKPVTADRLEKALDKLARIMAAHRSLAPKLLPLFTMLEEEVQRLHNEGDAMSRAMDRAKRSKDQMAV
jgi:hypothetical protein